ncbi:sulfate permease [Microbacterium sp. NPDC019599]|uniref:sulfate permease n=1 Tax=Microbacterium sp. NPDC019599 TaxID=3154690 RepID=UPI003405069F
MLSIRLRTFLRRFMPTNILLAAIFTRRGLKWGVPAMSIAVVYLAAAVLFAGLVGQGAPGWLNLLVLLCFWNALKFLAAGPASLFCLVRVRIREAQIRRLMRVAVMSEGIHLERATRAPARAMH